MCVNNDVGLAFFRQIIVFIVLLRCSDREGKASVALHSIDFVVR